MKKQAKKGFTIVELVIVIALIAILAAVLIPTFSNVINNAHESSDTMMVKNLNTILNAEEVDGNRADTMQEAVDQAEEGGYKVDKLTPTSSGDIVWDQESNRFLLINAKKEVVYKDESATGDVDLTNGAYKLWKITHDATKEDKGYSLYLANGAVAPAGAVEVGVDAGVNENVAVNFKSDAARDVIIRTNGGTLNVDAANATVSHYGEAEKVVITAVAGNSYHEYGKVVGNIEIAKGRVEVTAKAEVGTIIVKSVAAGDVKVEVVTGATVKAVAPATEAAKTDVTAATGVADNVKHEEIVTNTDKFAGGLGTEASPYLIANGSDFNNIFTVLGKEMGAGKYFYFKQIGDVVVATTKTAYYFNGHYDGGNNKIIADSAAQGVIYVFGVSKDNADFENLNLYSSEKAGLTLLGYSVSYRGGNTKLFYNGSASFTNVNTYAKDDVTVNLEGQNAANFGFFTSNAIYYWHAEKQISVTFDHCYNYANLVNSDRSAAFIGAYDGLDDGQHAKVEMKDCANYGNITVTSSDAAGAIIANSYPTNGWSALNEETLKNWMSLENVKNYGIIKGKTATAFGNASSTHLLNTVYQDSVGGTYISTDGVLKGVTATVSYDGTHFYAKGNKEEYTYKISMIVTAINCKEGTLNSRSFDLSTISGSEQGNKVTSVHAYDRKTAIEKGILSEQDVVNYIYDCAGFRVAVVETNGNVYLIFNEHEVTTVDCSVKLIAKVFNVSDEYVGSIEC